jgi:hypothetical protein
VDQRNSDYAKPHLKSMHAASGGRVMFRTVSVPAAVRDLSRGDESLNIHVALSCSYLLACDGAYGRSPERLAIELFVG